MLRIIPLIGLLLAVTTALLDPPLPINAAYVCGTTHMLRVDVLDLNGELITNQGSQVAITNDPQDGLGSRTYVDQGANDASVVIGRMQENRACSTDEGTLYTIELSFDPARLHCQDLVNTITTALTADTTVSFRVHDCLVPQATATPSPTAIATQTPLPTATTAPAPTNTPAPPTAVQCYDGSLAFPPFGRCPNPPAPAAPAAAVPTPISPTSAPASSVVIRPPSTGDAGLLP